MKNTYPHLLKRLATHSAYLYTVLTLVIILPCLIAGDNDQTVIHPLRMLLLLPLSAFFAAAGLVRRSDMKTGMRVVLHMLLCIGGFLLCGWLPYALENESAAIQTVLITLAALLIWIIGFVIYLFVGGRRQKQAKKRDSTDKYRGR